MGTITFTLWSIVAVCGLSQWLRQSRELRSLPGKEKVNAFCFCCSTLWTIMAIITPTPNFLKSSQGAFQGASLLCALFFTLQTFWYERESFLLKFASLVLGGAQIALFSVIPNDTAVKALQLIYRHTDTLFFQWGGYLVGLFLGALFLFVREKQGDWDLFTFFRRARKQKKYWQSSMRSIFLLQLYITFFAAISVSPFLRKALSFSIFSLFFVLVLVAHFWCFCMMHKAVFRPFSFILPAVFVVLVVGSNRDVGCPWAFLMLNSLFLGWASFSPRYEKNEHEKTLDDGNGEITRFSAENPGNDLKF